MSTATNANMVSTMHIDSRVDAYSRATKTILAESRRQWRELLALLS